MESSPPRSDEGDETPCPSSATATSGSEDVVTSLESVQRTTAVIRKRTRSLSNEREASHRNVYPMDGDDHWQRQALGRWPASDPKIGSIDGALGSNDGAGTAFGGASSAAARAYTDLTPLPGRSFDGGSLQQTDFSNWYTDEPNSSLMIHEEPIDRSRTDALLSSGSVSVPADELSEHQSFGSPSTVEDSLVDRAAITALGEEAETANLPSTEQSEAMDAFVPFGAADRVALVRSPRDALDSSGSQDAVPSQRVCSMRSDVYPRTLSQKYCAVPVEPLDNIARPRRHDDAERTLGTGTDRLHDGDASPEPRVDGARSLNQAQESVGCVPIGFHGLVSTVCSLRTTPEWLADARPQTVTGNRIASMQITAEGEDSAPNHMLNDAYETSPTMIGGMRQRVPITARSECGCVQASLSNTMAGSWAALHAFECLLQANELTPLASTNTSMSCVHGQSMSEVVSYPEPALVLRSTATPSCNVDAAKANTKTTFESPGDGESPTFVLATTSKLVSPIEGAAADDASTATANAQADTLPQQCASHAQGTSLACVLEPLETRAHANVPQTDAARVVADRPEENPPSQMKTMRSQDYEANPNVRSWVSDPRKRPVSLGSSLCERTSDTEHHWVDINGASEMTVDALEGLRIPELSAESALMAHE
ncbi:hypothetical protein F1559_000335 [Cyanidiococcus yangmingshanensis]|uniref:Uncharacterized protein n=1 Tax=Cyanidiococcus yangmingshanensis TaxID=2690220 RepID=A0A7J7IMH1_9RHOD|nr:hypothetical protein F1559_000335 [Cyanidiococcus yangmingshanensis]